MGYCKIHMMIIL